MDNNEDNLFDNSKEDKNSAKYQTMKNDVEKHLDDIISIDNRYILEDIRKKCLM